MSSSSPMRNEGNYCPYVSRIDSKIVLIDGDMLAQLMIDFGIGVTAVTSYALNRIDSDYFTED